MDSPSSVFEKARELQTQGQESLHLGSYYEVQAKFLEGLYNETCARGQRVRLRGVLEEIQRFDEYLHSDWMKQYEHFKKKTLDEYNCQNQEMADLLKFRKVSYLDFEGLRRERKTTTFINSLRGYQHFSVHLSVQFFKFVNAGSLRKKLLYVAEDKSSIDYKLASLNVLTPKLIMMHHFESLKKESNLAEFSRKQEFLKGRRLTQDNLVCIFEEWFHFLKYLISFTDLSAQLPDFFIEKLKQKYVNFVMKRLLFV